MHDDLGRTDGDGAALVSGVQAVFAQVNPVGAAAAQVQRNKETVRAAAQEHSILLYCTLLCPARTGECDVIIYPMQ